ncbi:MAG: DUF1624 domain-containing protein [Pedosphaera sp.]|nr:DUF1624 domain-containing protein [Pedosphaera sp.]
MSSQAEQSGSVVTPSVSSTPAARPRLESIDLLRGLIMVVMALDHTRDFFSNVKFDPMDFERTNVALFLTRWITHFCAPNFLFLAGVGAFLTKTRGRTTGELSWFLLSRGLWLAFLEVTWVHCIGWSFSFDLHHVGVGVLWAIGWSMVALAGLIWMPVPVVGAFGVALIVLHNAFDGVTPGAFGPLAWLWHVLHVPTGKTPLQPFAGWTFDIGYVLIPWMGVMAAGYAFGHIYKWEPERRRRLLLQLGLGLSALFIAVRWLNIYGDLRLWSPKQNALFTLFSFIDCHKYPPSLCYILMTVGPAMLVLRWLDRGTPTLLKPFIVFGRVPLFYYVLHLPLIHGAAVMVEFLRFGRAGWLFQSPWAPATDVPPTAGFDLPGVYLAWICIILILYPVCNWFAKLKQRRKDVWLSYL